MATWCEELTHWKRPWSWASLKTGGEGDDRGWDSGMASLTWWIWVWGSSGSKWWPGKPVVLQSMGLRRVGHDWAAELNWTEVVSVVSQHTMTTTTDSECWDLSKAHSWEPVWDDFVIKISNNNNGLKPHWIR